LAAGWLVSSHRSYISVAHVSTLFHVRSAAGMLRHCSY
jgi:hypothetical protein